MSLGIINQYLGAIQKQFVRAEKKARSISKDKEKSIKIIGNAFQRAYSRKKELTNIWKQLKLLLELANDYIRGNYTSIPYKSILILFAGIVYFVSPLDAIPDVILGLGFLDDIFVLSLIIKQLDVDINRYQAWKENIKETPNGVKNS